MVWPIVDGMVYSVWALLSYTIVYLLNTCEEALTTGGSVVVLFKFFRYNKNGILDHIYDIDRCRCDITQHGPSGIN